jgi:hypothetical protein
MRPSLQDVTERLRHASMAEGGLDVDKLVSDLIRKRCFQATFFKGCAAG